MGKKQIDDKVDEDILEIFEEANKVPCSHNINYAARTKHLERGQDLAEGLGGEFIAVKNYSSPEEDSD